MKVKEFARRFEKSIKQVIKEANALGYKVSNGEDLLSDEAVYDLTYCSSVKEYAEEEGETVEKVIEFARKNGYEVNSEEDILSTDAVHVIDVAFKEYNFCYYDADRKMIYQRDIEAAQRAKYERLTNKEYYESRIKEMIDTGIQIGIPSELLKMPVIHDILSYELNTPINKENEEVRAIYLFNIQEESEEYNGFEIATRTETFDDWILEQYGCDTGKGNSWRIYYIKYFDEPTDEQFVSIRIEDEHFSVTDGCIIVNKKGLVERVVRQGTNYEVISSETIDSDDDTKSHLDFKKVLKLIIHPTNEE